MTDLEPWLESDVPPEVERMLRAARAERPRAAVVERAVLATATLAATSTMATTAAAGSAGAPVGLVLVKWGLGGVLAGSLVAGGASALLKSEPSAVVAPQPAVARVIPAAVPSEPPVVPAAPRPIASAPSAVVPRLAPRPVPSQALPDVDGRLAEEVRLLDAVRRAVDSGQAERALALLATHQSRFGSHARLAPEARYLKMEAALLNQNDAQSAAEDILRHDPASPHARRAREVLANEKK